MENNAKALAIVLLLAGLVFVLAKPTALRFMSENEFRNRRNLWISLASVAFLTPSFWLYVPISALLIVRAARNDGNPAALFLIAVTAVPPVAFPIPTIGIGQIFDLNHPRLLAIFLLAPVAIRAWSETRRRPAHASVRAIDACVFAFFILQLLVQLPNDTFTNVLRGGVNIVLDYGLVYLIFSRSIQTQEGLREALAAFSLACAILAPIAVFETLRGWLLFQGVGVLWGKIDHGAFLMRGDSLRAQASGGHSLYFGFFMAIGFGFALTLARLSNSRSEIAKITALLGVGLIASFSRAPWLVAIISTVVYVVIVPMKRSSRIKVLLLVTIIIFGVLASPLGAKIIDLLPFVGTVDDFNVVYRQRLATESWNLILQNPFLGDPLVLRNMEHLRQGDGIIDIVNSYAAVALFYGIVGLFMFVLPILIGLAQSYRIFRRQEYGDTSNALVGAALVCSIIGVLIFIATCGYNWHLYAIIGLVVSYISLSSSRFELLKNSSESLKKRSSSVNTPFVSAYEKRRKI